MGNDLVVIAGPTASGKTALGIAVAERIGAEIISADSMQCYRGLEIGTAAPTAAERARVRHHFVSCIAPDAVMTAGEFQRRARETVLDLHTAGKRVVVVGGSGLYIEALVDGLFEGPPRQPQIRARLQTEATMDAGRAALLARLRDVDPAYAAALTSENDLVRIVRALEVYESSGETFSALHARHQAAVSPLTAHFYGLQWDRAQLYARINLRLEMMVAQGWLEEVRDLLDAGYGPQLERIKALGYREITAQLRGEQTLAEAVAKSQMHHRRLAKRQLTWFRQEPRMHWLPTTGTAEEIERHADAIAATLSAEPPE